MGKLGSITEATKIKGKAFAKEYVRNGFNGAAAIKTLKPYQKDRVAAVEAVRLLAVDNTKREIERVMEQENLTDKHLVKTLKKHIDQEDYINASLTGIDMAFKIKGHYAPEKRITGLFNIPGDTKSLTERIDTITQELAQLNKKIDS